jgi:hypothetical protein
MSYDLSVLRAILRLAMRREAANAAAVQVRAGGELADVRRGLRRLAASGLVERVGDSARLTMAGLAIAVATAKARAPKVPAIPRRARARARAA